MNNVERMFNESENFGHFVTKYYDYLFTLLKGLDVREMEAFTVEMEKARAAGNMVFFVGNGGSASTATHMVNDFGIDIFKKTGTEVPYRAMSLTDNSAVMLAIANDDGYDRIFVNQLQVYYQPGDKLVAISASGNSPNIVAAAEWVKSRGGTVMSLVGFDGGRLKEISDVVIHVKSGKGEYGPVEDIHMVMDHLLANWLQYKAAAENQSGAEYQKKVV